ncbi:fibrinogen C domain-containing protein 1-B-like [Sycon ciliatum]|uniref:fibrinogen C domain-containing protein 1-B-like n=1 Tax=Sycon ciliatum TaxID=27933 RepID=UPI0031F71CA1
MSYAFATASMVAMLLAVIWQPALTRSLRAEPNGTADHEPGNGSCMTAVLRLLPIRTHSVENTELLLKSIPPPVDQLNAASANLPILSALLGGLAPAKMLIKCLTGQLEACESHHPCSNAGACVFAASEMHQGRYQCHCNPGHTGRYCQIATPSCTRQPCANGGTCETTALSYRCHCMPFYSGKHCENKWIDEEMFSSLSTTVNKIAKDLTHHKQHSRHHHAKAISQMETILKNLERKIVFNITSSLAELNSRVVQLEAEHQNEPMMVTTPAYIPTPQASTTDVIDSSEQCSRRDRGPSGVFIGSTSYGPFTAYCDRVTDGGGWTVFQRRKDGSVDFFKDWDAYKQGFGSAAGEFWLGLDIIHSLTSQADQRYELRIDMIESTSESKLAIGYSSFRVHNESDGYRLLVSGFSTYTSDTTLGDWIGKHNKMQFTTFDRDNDQFTGGNCARAYTGAWWFKLCQAINLNGPYRRHGNATGVTYSFLGRTVLRLVELKFRKKV